MKLLWFLFLGGNALDCADAADTDDDGTLGISDSIAILGFLFARDAPPPGPGPAGCGGDPSPDGLSCDIGTCDAR
jgi:hypothetical protein